MSAPRTLARTLALPAAVVGFSALAVAPALAHVTISPGGAAANDYTVQTVSVPHGCDGSATTQVIIHVPEELVEVTPTRNALWDVTKTTKKLTTPIKAEDGDEITEKVDTVTYAAKTPLPDGYRDAFELNFQVPNTPGKTLWFPTIQKCVKGETDWTQQYAEGDPEPEHPAPSVKVEPAAASSSDAASASSSDDGASKGLAYTGLGVGIVGVLVGGAALAKSRRA
ncbi:MAG: YcnI family protein [Marmoricola sp.]